MQTLKVMCGWRMDNEDTDPKMNSFEVKFCTRQMLFQSLNCTL